VACPPGGLDPIAAATLVLGVAGAGFAYYQYSQQLHRDRIKATSDAIDGAAAIDAAYSHLRLPSRLAAANGLEHLATVTELLERSKSGGDQPQLNDFWDTASQVNNYFASSMALTRAKYLDEALFFNRLDMFTSVAFLIVYPGFSYLCAAKGLSANVRSFHEAA
jgi:hypothetical protein